jgi:hypothetical protein
MTGPASGATNRAARSAGLLGKGCKPWAQALLCALALGAAAPVWSADPCAFDPNGGNLPCTWGGCEFRKDADGVLARSGTCSARSTVGLNLDHRGITGLSAGVFDDVGAVNLVLNGNQLTSLPAGVFDPLKKLENLNLQGNQLTALPAGVFETLTRLKYLNLEDNQLKSLPAGVFDALTELYELYLYKNQLVSLPAGAFDSLTKLGYLMVNGNDQLICVPLSTERMLKMTTCKGPQGDRCEPLCATCETCSAGQYRTGCGGISGGNCAACGPGTYKKTPGSEPCSTCSGCPEGQTRTGCAGSSEGTCVTASPSSPVSAPAQSGKPDLGGVSLVGVLIGAAAGGVALVVTAAALLWYKMYHTRENAQQTSAFSERIPQQPPPFLTLGELAVQSPASLSVGDGMTTGVVYGIAAGPSGFASGGPPTAAAVALETSHKVAGEQAVPKFCAIKIKLGSSAISDLREFLGLQDDIEYVKLRKYPLVSMQAEWDQHGDANDRANFQYILHGEACAWDDIPAHVKETIEKGEYHGGQLAPGDYDRGHDGMHLEDFVQHPISQTANLKNFHVAALRMYTSCSFRKFNSFLRQAITPHPFRMNVLILDEALRKLRKVEATRDQASYASKKVLYRGMSDVEMDLEDFKRVGGNELALMSTTADPKIAISYASRGQVGLLFRYSTIGQTRGVSIDFLSLYPKEVEFLFPPLTNLTYDATQEEDDVAPGVTVIPVRPTWS